MHIRWFQHVPFEGLGSIESWAQAHGHTLSCTRLYTGELPPPVTGYDWLIVMGGPMNVYETSAHPWLMPEKQAIRDAIEAGRPVLGICLGAQLIAGVLGARIVRNTHKEIGWFPVALTAAAGDCPLFEGFPACFDAFHWHGDTFECPTGALHAARSTACAQQAFALDNRVVGLQFHLETTPASAAALVDNARHEIVPAPYVQDAAEILAGAQRFAVLNRLMDGLLDRMAV